MTPRPRATEKIAKETQTKSNNPRAKRIMKGPRAPQGHTGTGTAHGQPGTTGRACKSQTKITAQPGETILICFC